MAAGATGTQACAMQSIPHPTPDRHLGRLVWGTLAGASLVAVGLGLAFLVIATPLVARLVPGSRSGSSQLSLAMLVWVLAVAAGSGAPPGRDEPSRPRGGVRPRATREPIRGDAGDGRPVR